MELLAPAEATHAPSEALAFAAAMPAVSAEMLQAAMAGVAQHSVEKATAVLAAHGGEPAQLTDVLSDALSNGSQGKPDIDSLLSAIGDSGHHHGDLTLALAMAGPMGHDGFGLHASLPMMSMDETMVLHVAPPVSA